MFSDEESYKARAFKTGFPRGLEILFDPIMNKGTAFNERERSELGLSGLLPPRVLTQEMQALRVLMNFQRKPNNLERYIQLMALLDRNETLFYRVVVDHIEQMLPIIYTPTVGQACQEYGHIFRRPRGIFLSPQHRGGFVHLLRHWSHDDVRIISVTDGERILGLGDLGVYGIGAAVGKLVVYTACAGVHPSLCLPVTLDVGTDNAQLLEDPLYIGTKMRRLRGEQYDDFVDEFVHAVQEVFPGCLIQFEAISDSNAFRLLKRFQDKICIFDDDIQGRAAVVLAGLYGALRQIKSSLANQKVLILGANEAALAIGDMIVAAIAESGLSKDEARRRCWFLDDKGVIMNRRGDLLEGAPDTGPSRLPSFDLVSAVKVVAPTVLIGITGKPGAFVRPAIEAMAEQVERPILFALSNPAANAECSAGDAYVWTGGKAVFVSGNPMDTVPFEGKILRPGEANTAYLSPGVGLGVLACEASRVTDEMFFAAAKALAGELSREDLAEGLVYPPLKNIRRVSEAVATAVVEVAYAQGLANRQEPEDKRHYVKSQVYDPVYQDYV